jgi:hypothetical protein
MYTLTWLQEVAFSLMKKRPALTRYRVKSSQKRVVYDGSKLITKLGWQPPVSLSEALERLVRSKQPVPRVAAAPTTAVRPAEPALTASSTPARSV